MSPIVEVKIFAPIGLEAIHRKQDRGFMLWCLARALDKSGEGRISPGDLREACEKNKLSSNIWKKSRKQALENGWLIEGEDGHWYIPSLETIARDLELEYIGKYPVLLETTRLKKAGVWKASIWSAFHASRGPRTGPISRKTLEKLTKVPRRTQQAYDRKTRVQSRTNYKVIGDGSLPSGIGNAAREYGHPGAFEVHGQLWIQLANSYSSRLKRTGRGMCRRVNKSLRDVLLVAGDGERLRIYFNSKAQAIKAQMSTNRYDVNGIPSGMQKSREIWYRKPGKTSSGASIFLCL